MGKYEQIFRGRPVEDFDFEEILYEKVVSKWGIRRGDTLHLTLHRIIRYGRVMDV